MEHFTLIIEAVSTALETEVVVGVAVCYTGGEVWVLHIF